MSLYSYPKWNVINGERSTYSQSIINRLLEFSKKFVLKKYKIEYLKEIFGTLSDNVLGREADMSFFSEESENKLRSLMQGKFTTIIDTMLRTYDLEIDNQKLVDTFGDQNMGRKQITEMLNRYSMKIVPVYEELLSSFILDELDKIDHEKTSENVSPLDEGETVTLTEGENETQKRSNTSIIRVRTPFHLVPSVTILRQIPEGLPEIFRFFPIWRSVRNERKLEEEEVEELQEKLSDEKLSSIERQNPKWKELTFRILLDREYMKRTRSTIERIKRALTPFSILILDEDDKEYRLDVVIPKEFETVYQYILSGLENVRQTFSPRKLTSSEINMILEVVPKLPGKFIDITESVRASLQEFLRERLEEIIITPLGLADLTEDIERKFNYATRDLPQTPVGLIASEALAGPITQMTLNTFHQSGTSVNATSGIDAVRELIHLSQHRKNYNCVIHFKDKNLTFMEVAEMRKDLVGIRLGDIVTKYEVETPDNLIKYWWTQPYIESMGIKKFPESKWVMRMYCNVDLLYNYRIKMEDIVNSIDNAQENTLKMVPSPISYGIIDLYPQPEVALTYSRTKIQEQVSEAQYQLIMENADLLYLQRVVVPNYPKFLIKGIPGIHRIFPQLIPILSIIKEEIREYSDQYIENFISEEQKKKNRSEKSIMEQADRLSRIWRLIYNQFRMINTGIDQEKLDKLLKAVGVGIQVKTDNYIVVEMPPVPEAWMKSDEPSPNAIKNETEKEVKKSASGKPKIDYRKPSNYIQKKIEEDRDDEEKKEEEAKKMGNKLYLRPPTEITRAGSYTIAESDGTNLRRLLGNSLVDSRYTISNDFYEIFHILGIEALRNFLIKEFINVIASSSSYINPRHIVLLVEFMTNQGIPLPSTHTGISRQPTGAITKSTLDRAADTYKSAAGFGKVEAINTTSASICLGKKVSVGTGKISVISDSVTRRELEKAKNDLANVNQLTEDQVNAIINPQYVGTQFGDFESDMDSMFATEETFKLPSDREKESKKETKKETKKEKPSSQLSGSEEIKESDPIMISGAKVVSPLLEEAMKTLQVVPYHVQPEQVTSMVQVTESKGKKKLISEEEEVKPIKPIRGTSTKKTTTGRTTRKTTTASKTLPPSKSTATALPPGITEVKEEKEDFVIGGF